MPRKSLPWVAGLHALVLLALLASPFAVQATGPLREESVSATIAAGPALPANVSGAIITRAGSTILALEAGTGEHPDPQKVFAFAADAKSWAMLDPLPFDPRGAAVIPGDPAFWLVGVGEQRREVVEVTLQAGSLTTRVLPPLPESLQEGVALGTLRGKALIVPDGRGGLWRLDPTSATPAWTQETIDGTTSPTRFAATAFDRLVLFATTTAEGWVHEPRLGWTTIDRPPSNGHRLIAAAALGESHVVAVVGEASLFEVVSFHAITRRWTAIASLPAEGGMPLGLSVRAGEVIVPREHGTDVVTIVPPSQRFSAIDHAVVGAYLVGMLVMGLVIARREKGGGGFFTGGHRLPWWALGMSLFATAASAISLMTMPGKAYSGDWTYFTISIAAVICLPLSLYFVAPLVRRLGIRTSNEYLERRFGLAARVVGSAIYCLNQVLARSAPIIYLPSIVLASITGIDIWIWIVVVGVVTTLYTFLGGLAAVVWTDTVQGFVMVATVVGCLVLVLLKLEGPWSAMAATLAESDKLHVFELQWSITRDTFWLILISSVVGSLGGIGDQNFVQRVQAARSLGDTRKAVATQLAVAVPLNVLLFALGTALYLYYRQHPGQLDPMMKTDGVYPFFAAQHLPPGASGFVVAALLAASMSTISSAICSVANLGVDDFLRRWRPRTTEREALLAGRVLSVVVGILGIAGALYLANTDSKSVWDLALLISGLILNGIVGFFGLGLLTRRAHELGALVGVAAGMGFVFWLQRNTGVTFWLYAPLGSTVTFVVGWIVSVIVPWRRPDLAGLTIFNLRDAPREDTP